MPDIDPNAVIPAPPMDAPLERGDKTTRLEAFVDAAFAFAVTLLVISGDHIPASVEDLMLAFKSVPTFAASFALILVFWTGHSQWSRRYGLDDAATRRLSLLLVFLVLIFVYPLRMVFAALFSALSGGRLPANFAITDWRDVPILFVTYGVAFGALTGVMWMLYRHAWQLRDSLGLTAEERLETRAQVLKWAVISVTAMISICIALALIRFGNAQLGRWLGLPGYFYMVVSMARAIARRIGARPSITTRRPSP